jgi:hypothetical protein
MVITKLQFYRYCGYKCYKFKAKVRSLFLKITVVLYTFVDKCGCGLGVGRM